MKKGVILASATLIIALALGAGSYWLKNNQNENTNPSNIEISANEQRIFKTLTLANGLDVVLVSDQSTDKASAALNVFTGSWSNPEDLQGLAHFLEHMLFLGTEKYPEVDGYQTFIEQNGGHDNAYTASENTLYFFDINAPSLEPALDRFSQFFIAPLFDPEFSERERNAVQSEFSASLQNDERRIEDVVREIVSANHPASMLSIGNADTLQSANLSARLNQFFREHYVASNMSLAIYGPQDIATLERLAQQYFAGVRSTEIEPAVFNQALIEPAKLPLFAEIQSRRELRRLELRFPMVNTAAQLANKPFNYVGHLLGHESTGSLLSVLKQKGWAEELSAGVGDITTSSTTFNVRIDLTPEGLNNWQAAARLLFAHINLLKSEGVQPWLFEELKNSSALSFLYAEKVSASATAVQLAEQLRYYPAANILAGPYQLEAFNAEEIQATLNILKPDNALVLLTHPQAQTATKSQYYQTPYQLNNLSGNTVASWRTPSISQGLAIPSPNPFIPTDLSVLPLEREKSSLFSYAPQMVKSNDKFTLWFEQDDEFRTPKTDIHLLIETDAVHRSAEDKIALKLYLNLINDALNEVRYEAGLAGSTYQLSLDDRGILLRLYGYQEKLPLLLDTVMLELVEHSILPERLNIQRSELIRQLRNQAEQPVINQTVRQLNHWMTSNSFTLNAQIKAAQKMSAEQIFKTRNDALMDANLNILIHGNMTETQAIGLGERIDAVIPQGGRESVKRNIAKLPTKDFLTKLKIDHSDGAFLQYHQGNDASLRERALYALLAETMSAPYFTELRTKEQLGYIVLARAYSFDDIPGLLLYVQSPKTDPALIQLYSERFLSRFEQELANMNDLNFLAYKEGIIASLKEPAKNLYQLSADYWQAISTGNQHFNTRVRLATEIEKISLDGFRRFYKNRILSDESRSVTLHQIGRNMQQDYNEHAASIVGFYPLSATDGWPDDVSWVTPSFNNIAP